MFMIIYNLTKIDQWLARRLTKIKSMKLRIIRTYFTFQNDMTSFPIFKHS